VRPDLGARVAYYRDRVLAFRANPASKSDLVDELDRVVTLMERLAMVD